MVLEPSAQARDTHLKSLLDVVLESSQKRLIALRAKLKDDPAKLAESERHFMLTECAKLENLGDLQIRLDAYREKHLKSSTMDKAKEVKQSGNSGTLGDHLRAAGQFKPNHRWHAHHIVCSRHSSHAPARLMLFAYLGVNDPFNGCWLPKKHADAKGSIMADAVGHSYIHTNDYAKWVGRSLRPARNKAGMINRLRNLRMKLQSGKRQKDVVALLTEKGKADFYPALKGGAP